MRNLTPHRRFKGVSNYQASFRPYYRRPWPKDLPPECTICGTAFIAGFNLDVGPNKIGRILRSAAFYGFMPCLIGSFAIPYILSYFFEGFDTGTGGLIFAGLLFTPVILSISSFVMPIKRRVECKKCGWEQYFKTIPDSDLTQIPPAKE
ncbi:MAG: hypothetical protein ACSHX9_03015 [Luteolibacter sp.]